MRQAPPREAQPNVGAPIIEVYERYGEMLTRNGRRKVGLR
jgi:hypothetical protein